MNLPSPWSLPPPKLLTFQKTHVAALFILHNGSLKLPSITSGVVFSGLTPTIVSSPTCAGNLVSFGEPVYRWNVEAISGP